MKKIITPLLVIICILAIGINVYLYQQIQGIKNDNKTVNSEIAVLKEGIGSKDTQISENDSTLGTLEQEIEDKSVEKEELETKKVNLETEKDTLSKENEALSLEIETLQEELESEENTQNTQGTSTASVSSETETLPEGCTTAEEFSKFWGVPVYGPDHKNPNSTGGDWSQGIIWG